MKYEIKHKPLASIVKATFEAPGESLVVEASAMVAQSSTLKMTTSIKGGLLAAAKRKAFGGESLFQNTFTAGMAGDELYFAHGITGDIIVEELTPEQGILIASNNYIAGDPRITLDAKFSGLKGLFSSTGLAMLRASGSGPLFLGSIGAIHVIDIGPEGYIVDNDHIVAFDESLTYEVRKLGTWKQSFFSGEGFVCEFSGNGRVWLSTRSAGSMAEFLSAFRLTSS